MQASSDLAAARDAVNRARDAFQWARNKADEDLRKAQDAFGAADRAFNDARDAVYAELGRKRQDVDRAQRE